MAKRIVAVNCSPRKGWNTDILVTEAARGAEEAGAIVEKFDLYRLEKYTGCVSCFGCKRPGHEGKCICKDGLAPVLEAIRNADGLILGTPNYFGDVTAGFRALYERLLFQYLTYQKERMSYNEKQIPVLLIMTSNTPASAYPLIGYNKMLRGYKKSLESFIGPTELLICGETQQVADYSKFNWTMFDGAERAARRERVFPKEKEKAFLLGKSIVE